MKMVFVIMWLGFPYVFRTYDSAKSWLLDKAPDLSDVEVRIAIHQRLVL